MGVILNVIDENGNGIPFNRIKVTGCNYTSFEKNGCDEITVQIFDKKDIFTIEDLRYLKWLLGEKLKYGGNTVTEMRKYAEIYEKIEKELEENNINQ